MYRKFLTMTVALCCCLLARGQFVSGYADLDDSETMRVFREDVSAMSSVSSGVRSPGSKGEAAAAKYMRRRLKEAGLEMFTSDFGEVFGIRNEGGDTLTSRNIYGVVQGYDKKLADRYIVVGARLDTPSAPGAFYPGANGNASGLAMLCRAAAMVSANARLLRRSVVFIAFGASSLSYSGAWYFLNRSFPDSGKIDAMVNLDALGGGTGFCAFPCGDEGMAEMVRQASSRTLPAVPDITENEPFASDHRAFSAYGIPSVMLSTGLYPAYNTPRDTPETVDYALMEKESEFICQFLLHLACSDEAPSAGKPEEVINTYAIADCDTRPSFMGGDLRRFLSSWVYQYLKYPREAVEKGIQGRVHVRFTIGADGKVKDVSVAKGADPLLDAEALRVVSASPSWKPGKKGGRKVDAYTTIPVDFILKKK